LSRENEKFSVLLQKISEILAAVIPLSDKMVYAASKKEKYYE